MEFVTKAKDLMPSGTPLRKFKGKLDDIVPEADSATGRTVMHVNFTDVEAIECIPGAVYPYPTAQINIGYRVDPGSGRPSERSIWGRLLISAEELGFEDIMLLKGKVVMMVGTTESFGKNRQTGEEMEGLVWRVAEAEGGAGQGQPAAQSAEDKAKHLAMLADGKTAGEFAAAALQDPIGKEHQAQIFDRTLLPTLVQLGLLELKENKYHLLAVKP